MREPDRHQGGSGAGRVGTGSLRVGRVQAWGVPAGPLVREGGAARPAQVRTSSAPVLPCTAPGRCWSGAVAEKGVSQPRTPLLLTLSPPPTPTSVGSGHWRLRRAWNSAAAAASPPPRRASPGMSRGMGGGRPGLWILTLFPRVDLLKVLGSDQR